MPFAHATTAPATTTNAPATRVGTRATVASTLVVAGLVAAASGPAGPVAAAAQASDPAAVRLVDDWIDALGGMETYWKLRTARFTITTEMYDAESGRLRRTRPRYVVISKENGEKARIERWEGDDYIVQGFDGARAWATLNGAPLGPGDKDFDEVRYVSGDVNYWIALPFKLKDPGVFLHDDGVDGAGRHVVRVTFGDGVGDHQDVWHYYFVEGRVWPVQVDYQEAGKTDVHHTRWEDIRVVDGYPYVGARVHFDDQGRVTKVLRTHDVELNPALPAETFSPPSTEEERAGGA